MNSSWTIFEKSLSGHRREYCQFFSQLLKGKPLFGFSWKSIYMLVVGNNVLFSSCDDYFIIFFIIANIRKLFGKRTIAIATRPESVYKGNSFRLDVKKKLYKGIKKSHKIKVFSILPFSVEPRLEELVDDWIYDPQFWDYKDKCLSKKEINEGMLGKIMMLERMAVILPGKISNRKGADFMMDIYMNNACVREKFDFVLAGEILDLQDSKVEMFKSMGGVVIDRRLSEKEIVFIYSKAAMIWCCYPPEFNHSSGIFGRSLQFGVPAIVRGDSYLDKFNVPDRKKIRIKYNSISKASVALIEWEQPPNKEPFFLSSKDKIKKLCTIKP